MQNADIEGSNIEQQMELPLQLPAELLLNLNGGTWVS